jgi:hypothetical protein
MLTGLGRLALVIGFLTCVIILFLSLGYNSRNLRSNIQSYVESQQ